MTWTYSCGDCSWQGPEDDLNVVDQMELIEQLLSGAITEEFFVEMGSRIGQPSCPECGSAEVGPE